MSVRFDIGTPDVVCDVLSMLCIVIELVVIVQCYQLIIHSAMAVF